MAKTIWQRVKQNHLLLMVLCCIVPIILVIGFFILFKGGGNWVWLFILLCPILHIWMMKGHKHHSCQKEASGKSGALYQCPECKLEYKEEKWAKKCEAWCRKYKSCNLEITKHAINPVVKI